MRCEFCRDRVVGQADIVIVDKKGPAHQFCYEQFILSSNIRTFKGINFSELTDREFIELKNTILFEENSRVFTESVVELF
jgi:hypothetical protein